MWSKIYVGSLLLKKASNYKIPANHEELSDKHSKGLSLLTGIYLWRLKNNITFSSFYNYHWYVNFRMEGKMIAITVIFLGTNGYRNDVSDFLRAFLVFLKFQNVKLQRRITANSAFTESFWERILQSFIFPLYIYFKYKLDVILFLFTKPHFHAGKQPHFQCSFPFVWQDLEIHELKKRESWYELAAFCKLINKKC